MLQIVDKRYLCIVEYGIRSLYEFLRQRTFELRLVDKNNLNQLECNLRCCIEDVLTREFYQEDIMGKKVC